MSAPTICAVIIARNEERDLPKCITSLKGVADKIVLVDTGSTDNTLKVARETWAAVYKPVGWEWLASCTYHDASELNPDKPGEWRIVNFGMARNHALELAEQTECSHILWLDADDQIVTPLAIRRAPYLPDAVIGVWVELGGGVRQLHHRMWPAHYKVRFEGWVHEYPMISQFPLIVLNDGCIVHDGSPHASAGEDSNQRNMRILAAEYAHEPNARTAFYLANTHKDGHRWKEAARWYSIRIAYGNAWRDEYLFAKLYWARCNIQIGDMESARALIEEGISDAPDWQEFRMELAFLHYKEKDYARAIDEATKSLDKPIPPTVLWREKDKYRDQPARLISWCHEHMGNLSQAFVWSQLATRLIGQHDADWARREQVLEYRLNAPMPPAPAIITGMRERIALHRPGAIGDILMTLNLVPAFKEAHPGVDLHYYCNGHLAKMDQLGSIIIAAGCDFVGNSEHLDRKQYDRVIDLVGYPLAEGYPEKPMRCHLLDYFADELGILRGPYNTRGDLMHDLPSLTLRRPKRPLWATDLPAQYATLQTAAGWSRYKCWFEDRWQAVARSFSREELPLLWIDESEGLTLSQSIALFANARMHIGIDSFCNHLTNFTWTDDHGGRRVRAVILWGSTQASAAGYPDNINISKGLPCQPCFRENPAISRMPRGPCINPPRPTYEDDTPHACMDAITVEEVVGAVRTMWESTGKS